MKQQKVIRVQSIKPFVDQSLKELNDLLADEWRVIMTVVINEIAAVDYVIEKEESK